MNHDKQIKSYKVSDTFMSQRLQQITDSVKRFWSPYDLSEEPHNARIAVYRYKYKERWSNGSIDGGMFIWRRLHTYSNPNPDIWALAADNDVLGR